MEKWVNFTFKNRKGKLHFTMMDCCVKEEERQYMVGGGGGVECYFGRHNF